MPPVSKRPSWYESWWAVWLCRLIVGGTFVFSGVTKMIDLWGFVYKIEQYLAAWAIDEPRTLVLGVAMCLAGAEFLLGFLLFTGCYRRSAPVFVSLIMVGMTGLTAYIAIADPVDDCGCFGDAVKISNTATFLKNVVLMMLCLVLLGGNRKVAGLFTPYSQWLVALIAIVYIGVVGALGYNVQPLVDFRPYPVGTPLVADTEGADATETMRFIYTDGTREQAFSADSLPDDPWEFVRREESDSYAADKRSFTVYDGDIDVTDEVITSDGDELLVLIPEPENASIASTYLLNDLYRYATERGGSVAGILGAGDEVLEQWRDISLADYPLYTTDESAIKEVARGDVALVWLHDGVILWKSNLVAIDSDQLNAGVEIGPDGPLNMPGPRLFGILSLCFIGLEAILWLLDRSGYAVSRIFARRETNNHRKSSSPNGQK